VIRSGKAAEEVGIRFILKKFEAAITQEDLIKEVRALSEDESVHGYNFPFPTSSFLSMHALTLCWFGLVGCFVSHAFLPQD